MLLIGFNGSVMGCLIRLERDVDGILMGINGTLM